MGACRQRAAGTVTIQAAMMVRKCDLLRVRRRRSSGASAGRLTELPCGQYRAWLHSRNLTPAAPTAMWVELHRQPACHNHGDRALSATQ